ncbi:aminotransferase class V-fold PLP-dependent enzyme [Kitasatospora aureofaciens]|nr:aminotransferase class V-fold PLP-dependent enzyme [Kitasatospora aureofaciens]
MPRAQGLDDRAAERQAEQLRAAGGHVVEGASEHVRVTTQPAGHQPGRGAAEHRCGECDEGDQRQASRRRQPDQGEQRRRRTLHQVAADDHRPGRQAVGQQATQVYEEGREEAAKLLGTQDTGEIVFVRGTTEAVNLVAQSWGRANLGLGDEILVSAAEHHSNLVPWQLIAKEHRARIRPIPLLPDGQLDQDAYRDLLGSRTKLVALTHTSNVLGTVPPVAEMTALAHRNARTGASSPTRIEDARALDDARPIEEARPQTVRPHPVRSNSRRRAIWPGWFAAAVLVTAVGWTVNYRYGSAYLSADFQGNVKRTQARSQ